MNHGCYGAQKQALIVTSDIARLTKIHADMPKGNLSKVKAAEESHTIIAVGKLQRLMKFTFAFFELEGENREIQSRTRRKAN